MSLSADYNYITKMGNTQSSISAARPAKNSAVPIIITQQKPIENDYYKDINKEEYIDDIEKINKDVFKLFGELHNQLILSSITVREVKENIKNFQTFFDSLNKKDKFIYLSEISRFLFNNYTKHEPVDRKWTDSSIQGIKKYALYVVLGKFVYENS